MKQKMRRNLKRINIITDEQIRNCIMSKAEVGVWWNEEINLISNIIEFTEHSVKFAEGSVLRGNVEIITWENYFRVV